MSMNISSSDLQALQAMFQGANNIPWSQLLGQVTLNTPAAGTPTLDALNQEGLGVNGDPTLTAQTDLGSINNYPTLNNQQLYGGSGGGMADISNFAAVTGSYDPKLGYAPVLGFYDGKTGQYVTSIPGHPELNPANWGATTYDANGNHNPAAGQEAGVSSFHWMGPGAPPAGVSPSGSTRLPGIGANNMVMDPSQFAKVATSLPDIPTLSNQENYAQDFGRLGSFSTDPNAVGGSSSNGGPLTLAAQKQYMDAILNAPKGPADAFSYLAKEQSMADPYNPVSQLLGNNVRYATGLSLSDLSGTPTLTNTQLAGDLVNSQNGGSMSPLTQQFLARSLQPPATDTSGGAGQSPGGVPNDPALGGGSGTTIIGGTHYHSPVGFQATTGLPTGFQTSLQQFNRLEPESQAAFLDLQQAAGGQTPTDFNAGLKQGAPEFGKAATGSIAASQL